MRPLRFSINVTLDGCYDHTVGIADADLHRNAMELVLRAPASPVGGDAASDVMIIQDPWSGLVFEISVYKGFKKTMIMVGAVWGKKAWKPDFIATVLG